MFDVQPGDIWQCGKHRIMCGDATSKEDVKRLFDGRQPTMVVTSPPYAKQRDYDRPIACWDTMMLGAFSGHDFSDSAQLLIVLGVIHKKGEWLPYWTEWLSSMRDLGWQIASQYIWDKVKPPFGQNQGRCRSEHEFIFHLRKQKVLLNEIIPNKTAGKINQGKNPKDPSGRNRKICTPGPTKSHRPPTSIFRCMPAFDNKTSHPAVFPVALAQQLIAAFTTSDGICYDSFVGTGSTLLAAENLNIAGLGIDIAPAYVGMSLERWAKAYPEQMPKKVRSAG